MKKPVRASTSAMDISRNLWRFMARREGIVTVVYRDGKGYSIGCGHYLGEHPTEDQLAEHVTERQALELLREDIEKRLDPVNAALDVPVSQSQFDALVSLYYQGGSDGLGAVAEVINERDPNNAESCLTSDKLACAEFLCWDTSQDGTHMRGLFARRAREVAVYGAAEYGSDLDAIPLWHVVDAETLKPRAADMVFYTVSKDDFVLPKA